MGWAGLLFSMEKAILNRRESWGTPETLLLIQSHGVESRSGFIQLRKVTGDINFWTGSSGVQTWKWIGRERAERTNHRIFVNTMSPKCLHCSVSAGIVWVSGWKGAAVCGCKHISLAVHINPQNQQRRSAVTSFWFCCSLTLTFPSRPCPDGSFTQVWSTWLF